MLKNLPNLNKLFGSTANIGLKTGLPFSHGPGFAHPFYRMNGQEMHSRLLKNQNYPKNLALPTSPSNKFAHSTPLFSPQKWPLTKDNFIFPKRNITTKTPEQSFNELTQFIKKNTYIPDRLAKIAPDDAKLNALFAAIKKGQASDPIFSDPDCYLYLLYLIQKEKIPFLEAISVYIYLMTLMQYTNTQPLKPEDADVKLLRDISVESIVKDQRLTDAGDSFLKRICVRLDQINQKINYQDLVKFVLTLSPAEQWLIKIPYEVSFNRDSLHHSDRLTDVLIANISFLKHVKTQDKDFYWLPSPTLINYILHKISSNPIEPYFIFGSIGTEALQKLHRAGKHPVPLYAPQIKSNLKSVHNFRCGPVPILLHDIGHTFWGTLIPEEDRKFIFNEFASRLAGLTKEAAIYEDDQLIAWLKYTIDEAYDFDLTNIYTFPDNPQSRLVAYLTRTFRKANEIFLYDTKLGARTDDRLVFLLWKMYSSTQFPDDHTKELWKNILYQMKDRYFQRKPTIVEALLTLAGCSPDMLKEMNVHSDNFKEVNWKAWLKLLRSTTDSEKIWEVAMDQYPDELLTLICREKLKFFHPYLPLTAAKHKEFLKFLENKVNPLSNWATLHGTKETESAEKSTESANYSKCTII